MDYAFTISKQLKLNPQQVASAIELFETGNTLPFIARYRKEATSGLDEEQLRKIQELLEKLRSLEDRRQTILRTIEEQGQLSEELRLKLQAAQTLTELEDLYQPYKPKRRTRATVAREQGLEPLAEFILQQERAVQSLDEMAGLFLNDQVQSVEQAWAGARDIVAEVISDHPEVRRLTREKAMQWGNLRTGLIEDAKDERKVYESYYKFDFRIDRIRPHQILAINRGEAEKVLRVGMDIPERDWQAAIASVFRPDPRSPLAGQLKVAIEDSAERLLLPAIERDVRRMLTEAAEIHAIAVFGANLRALLNQPPLAGHTILGIDPGFRTGCKIAVIDPTGKVLATDTIYPHEPQKLWIGALETLFGLSARYGVSLISIGNGTASRETEQLAAELIQKWGELREKVEKLRIAQRAHTKPIPVDPPQYLIVNEAGASVYSASPLARQEFPELDVSLRGAVSIARRAQDPLAELVKIDPKSIGVGLYQHDVDQKRLTEALAGVVESAVNSVGVEVNTASPALLTHVAGIGPKLAERIVSYRDENGPFSERADLREVSGLGPKAFEQAAGFLRIRDGNNPLDASAIHPESYAVAEAVLRKAGIDAQASLGYRKQALEELMSGTSVEKLAVELKTGAATLSDILEQLVRPGRDPRQDLPAPALRSDVLKMEDLSPGMKLKGTVRNVVDFGAFIDIGVKQDGLLHRTQIPPGTLLKVGETIEVQVIKIEAERGRIALGWPGRGK